MTNPREKVRVGWLPAKLSFLLLFFCLQIQANVYSQQTRVSIKLDNVSVQQLFVEIERITDLAFVYNTIDVESLGMMDVDFENVKDKVSYITPVPGGVGPMTITMLMYNTYIAATRR